VVPEDVLEHGLPVLQTADRAPERVDGEGDAGPRDDRARAGVVAACGPSEVSDVQAVALAQAAALRGLVVVAAVVVADGRAVERLAVLDEELGEHLVLDGARERLVDVPGLAPSALLAVLVLDVELALELLGVLVDEALEEVGGGGANARLLLVDEHGDLVALLVVLEEAVLVDLVHDLERLDADGEVVLADRHADELLLEAVGEVVELAEVGVLLVKRQERLDRLATSLLGL